MKKFLWIMLVLVMLVGCSSGTTKEDTEKAAYIEGVEFEEIYRAYKENKLAAEDVYQYNRYKITAEINGMATGGLNNMTGGATLTMTKRIGNKIAVFYAEFEKEQEENLKKVKVGDTISFIGKCYGVGNWVECELITE